MQYSNINGVEVSRFGLGTKRFPTQDRSKVIHLDTDLADEVLKDSLVGGVNFFDTSYSNHKGEAETWLGEELSQAPEKTYVATSFFEMVDPRFDYVFQKQQKKLQRECIDFYHIEGVTDLMRNRDIDSGAIDFFFKEKEAGHIGQLGFSAELKAENLKEYLSLYPWDFVRLRINFYDWFMKGARECYEVACEAGVPIIAHGALRMGPKAHLKPEAFDILKENGVKRGEVEWGLLFVKSLDGISTVSCNVFNTEQLAQDLTIFDNDTTLTDDDLALLKRAAEAQKTVIPGRA